MKKTIIWILGTNAVGKTSLSRNIHHHYNDNNNYKLINTPNRVGRAGVTFFDNTAHIGFLEDGVATGGSDMISKKVDFERSVEFALKFKKVNIIVLDALMATGQWKEFLRREDVELITIHLFCSERENIKRLIKRRTEKYPNEPQKQEVSEYTASKVFSKRRYYFNLYNWAEKYSDCAVEIDTTKIKSPDRLFEILVENGILP
jgi:hypothetical protein